MPPFTYIEAPPSTAITWPVTYVARPLASATTISATSSGRPNLRNGVVSTYRLTRDWESEPTMSVDVRPGDTQFTEMPNCATSLTRAFENPTIAAFEAEYAVCPAVPRCPLIDVMFTINPERRR